MLFFNLVLEPLIYRNIYQPILRQIPLVAMCCHVLTTV